MNAETTNIHGRRVRMLLLEIFAAFNLSFLALDIYLAHSYNEFAHRAEWVPFWFSIIGTIVLLPSLTGVLRGTSKNGIPGIVVGALSILVGLVGLYYHLESQFLVRGDLTSLVYSAPLAAPLSYCGIGMLLLLNRLKLEPAEWGSWVIFMAAGGFFGNFALTVLDHAQNGFFHVTEWLAVASSALAWSFSIVATTNYADRKFLNVCFLVMLLQVVIGSWGCLLHYQANIEGVSESIWDNFVFGAPIFAPMLLCNMAILAAIGLYDRRASFLGPKETC